MTPNIEEISDESQEHVHPKDLPKIYMKTLINFIRLAPIIFRPAGVILNSNQG